MTTPDKPAKLGPFLGLSNRREDYELHSTSRVSPGDYMARAENVDITNSGNIKRRDGFALAFAGSDCHSLWSNVETGDNFFADGQFLKRIREQTGALAVTIIRDDLVLGRLLTYTHDGIDPCYSDGIGNYRVRDDDTQSQLAPPLLEAVPFVTQGVGGSITPGRYQFAFTYGDADGREGGTTDVQQIFLSGGNSTLSITNLPSTFPDGVVSLIMYMTTPNGDLLLRALVLTTPASSFLLSVLPTLSGRCMSKALKPLPAGSMMRFVNGRMHSAVGSVLFYSEPYAPGLYKPESGYVPFVSPITMIETTPNSIYIASGIDTWYITGDIATATIKPVLPYGAVPRASGQIINKESCWWLSQRGICVGDDDGTVTNRQEAEVMIDPAAAGAALYRESDGMKQLIASTYGTQPSGAVVGSWAEAEVIHKADQS